MIEDAQKTFKETGSNKFIRYSNYSSGFSTMSQTEDHNANKRKYSFENIEKLDRNFNLLATLVLL